LHNTPNSGKVQPYPGALTDITGLAVGHAAASGRNTGCTVVLCPQGVVCGASIRGGAPGTRETDLLRPENTVQQVHAVLLTGGSAFGLDAASGVVRWLEAHGHGLPVGAGTVRVPIVPAAVLFDLWQGDWRIRPTADTGFAACEAAHNQPAHGAAAQGKVGAGLGATVGKFFGIEHASPGGLGMAAVTVGGITVAALVVVNAVGDVLDEQGAVLAGARRTAEPGQAGGFVGATAALLRGDGPARVMAGMGAGTATTIGVVATNALLTKTQATQLAHMAHHGLARAVSPITPHDGDSFFALATGGSGLVGDASALGVMAAEAVSRAIRNGVRAV
jgi:L-aminopeptidase/D-esterase-like protein